MKEKLTEEKKMEIQRLSRRADTLWEDVQELRAAVMYPQSALKQVRVQGAGRMRTREDVMIALAEKEQELDRVIDRMEDIKTGRVKE